MEDDPQADIEGEGVVTVIDEGDTNTNPPVTRRAFSLETTPGMSLYQRRRGLAQLGERHNGNVEVSGSIPLGSTISQNLVIKGIDANTWQFSWSDAWRRARSWLTFFRLTTPISP